VAGAFIASATGVPEQISAAIILYDPTDCPTKTVTLSIYTDACWPIGPGTSLVSAVATVPSASCGLAVAKLANTPTLLIKGTKYWAVATTDAQQAGLDSSWYGSNNAQYALNMGDGWQHVNGITPALMVEGSGIGLSQTPIDPIEPLEAICLWTPALVATIMHPLMVPVPDSMCVAPRTATPKA
jgi:hypothetical protein